MFRFRTVAIAAAAALALVGAAAQPAEAGPDTPNRGRYAAIGDSYAAGLGSSVAYPVLLAGQANKVNFLAVSGATTQDVATTQVDRITPGVRQVTLTVGGNDVVDFGLVVAACASPSVNSPACAAALQAAEQKLPVMTANLEALIKQVQERAPRAEIYVTGYPILFQAAGTACPEALVAVDAANARLNTAIESAAVAAGATFVDVTEKFSGHGLCQGVNDSWILGPDSAAALHPTTEGQEAYAAAIEATSFTSAAES